MNPSRLQIAKSDIVSHFDGLPSPVLKMRQIQSILSTQRAFWRLTQSTATSDFIAFLAHKGRLREMAFAFPQRAETCYVWGDVPLLAVLQDLRKDLHYSHYTAMRMLGLTEQTPTAIYLTDERRGDLGRAAGTVVQSDIDRAFRQPPRVSQNWVTHADRKIHLLNGASTGHAGVITLQVNDDESGREIEVRLTGLERTLIDITVRPVYAGGIHEVAKAFALARDRISVNKLLTLLRKLAFVYPYHQAIGYYLERAGYKASQLDLVRRLPVEHDFYLAHDMGAMCHVSEWRLFVPEGF